MLADVGIAENVTVPVKAEAPVGAMLTVPALLAIVSTLLLAEVGTAETVTVPAEAAVAPLGVIFDSPVAVNDRERVAAGRRGHRGECDRAG